MIVNRSFQVKLLWMMPKVCLLRSNGISWASLGLGQKLLQLICLFRKFHTKVVTTLSNNGKSHLEKVGIDGVTGTVVFSFPGLHVSQHALVEKRISTLENPLVIFCGTNRTRRRPLLLLRIPMEFLRRIWIDFQEVLRQRDLLHPGDLKFHCGILNFVPVEELQSSPLKVLLHVLKGAVNQALVVIATTNIAVRTREVDFSEPLVAAHEGWREGHELPHFAIIQRYQMHGFLNIRRNIPSNLVQVCGQRKLLALPFSEDS
mmetsp:Transcript_16054/g.25027  ORF Transcript_16054/g.25027 Transcript_16054/m.25027 type:complete len:260 (-) Transcript_16054:71-850(-)